MSETGTFTSRVADVLKRRETLRIAAPAGAAVVVVGVLLGVFLTGGDEPDETTGQSVEIADSTAESTVDSVSPAGEAEPTTADAATTAPAEETAPTTADAGAPKPAEPKPEETAEAPPVPADVPGGDIDAGPDGGRRPLSPHLRQHPRSQTGMPLSRRPRRCRRRLIRQTATPPPSRKMTERLGRILRTMVRLRSRRQATPAKPTLPPRLVTALRPRPTKMWRPQLSQRQRVTRAGTDTMVEGDGRTASAADAAVAAGTEAADDAAGADTMVEGGDGTAPVTEEDATAAAEAQNVAEDAGRRRHRTDHRRG